VEHLRALWLNLLSVLVVAGCVSRTPVAEGPAAGPMATPYSVSISPADFVGVVDNLYFPLLPGTRYIYESQTGEGVERVEVEVLSETREVIGISATIVRDTVTLDGELIEDTFDWFAQDRQGNVWYLGEDVSNYENGQLADRAGSWEAGVDGALPGIIMYAVPSAHIGETYRQEYYPGEAEDMADLMSADESVTVPYGPFDDVVQTRDYTPLEPGIEEHKYYAPGIGLIWSEHVGSEEELVLISFMPPGG